MTAYYNEIDPYAAAWLRNLIAAGHIADGVVDERSIEDVLPSDLRGFTQCHFFAGIGVWSHALRTAGWSDDRPVWTGSCPCQPFSAAGKGSGTSDERHLWPAWHHLIRECRPDVVFGEQVEAAIAHGWLDLVLSDLEAEDYAFAAFGLPAASVGAPHIRQRLWFVADDHRQRRISHAFARLHDTEHHAQPRSELGHADSQHEDAVGGLRREPSAESRGGVGVVVHAGVHHRAGRPGEADGVGSLESDRSGDACGALGHAECHGLRVGRRPSTDQPHESSYWALCDWIDCRDGKRRPVEPGTFPLAHGAPARVGRLRAYGNAIVAPLAARFIQAYMSRSAGA